MESDSPEAVSQPQTPQKPHDADLTKAMEHLRPFVSASSTYTPRRACPSAAADPTTTDPSHTVYGVPSSIINPPRQPSSADAPEPSPSNPNKRTDPFQFGSRYLHENDDIYAFNAWDHVDIDEDYRAFSSLQYAHQRENPVPAFDRARINAQPDRAWNRFYTNNSKNFFKDRKWLFQEFPTLADAAKAPEDGSKPTPVTVLEIGAGAGNTAFPLLRQNENPHLRVHAVDFSKAAVDVMRKDEAYDTRYMQADVWDLAAVAEITPADTDSTATPREPSLPPNIAPGSVDIAVMIFVFSALSPAQWGQALRNVWAALRPGGEVLFRDYGRGDLAQVRFKKGRWLDDNFYVRGDGTRVYFFDEDELRNIWGDGGSGALRETEGGQKESWPRFEILNLGTDRRMLVNRQRKLKMYRCWMQGRFRKPFDAVPSHTGTKASEDEAL